MNAARELHNQVMWNRLISIVEEQALTLVRTAFSTSVREAGDLSAGVFDTEGRMIAQAVTGTPGHVNSMAEAVGHFCRAFPLESMEPGDVFVTNDPWMGTGHLNDFTVVTPCFLPPSPIREQERGSTNTNASTKEQEHEQELIALMACTSHL